MVGGWASIVTKGRSRAEKSFVVPELAGGIALVLHLYCTGSRLVLLHWHGTSPTLVSHECCVGIAQAPNVVLSWYFTVATPVFHEHYYIVHCSGLALAQYCHCVVLDMVLHCYCVGTVLVLHWHRTHVVVGQRTSDTSTSRAQCQ